MTGGDILIGAVADGIRRRVAERGRAEAQLAAFVFGEGRSRPERPWDANAADWRYFVSRTLAVAGEPGTMDFLERLAGESPSVTGPAVATDASAAVATDASAAVAAHAAMGPAGQAANAAAAGPAVAADASGPAGLAAADRVGVLAAAGLVGRDLETGRVSLSELGAAVLDLIRELERRAAAPAAGDAGAAR
jgi:hypothetical protein